MNDNDAFEEIYTGDDVKKITADLQAELATAKHTICRLVDQNAALTKQIETLSESLASVKQVILKTSTELGDCLREKSGLLEEIAVLKKSIGSTVNSNGLNMSGFLELIAWRSSDEESILAIEKLREKVNELSIADAPYRKLDLSSSSHQSSKEEQQLEKQLKAAEDEKCMYQKEIENLREQMKTQEFFIESSFAYLDTFQSISKEERTNRIKEYINYVHLQLQAISETNQLGIDIKILQPTK